MNPQDNKQTPIPNHILSSFQKIWGYADFRPPQGEIVRTILEQKDALIVMPTGAGKSICFQLPAIIQTGLTLVISPLVALMENQIQELQQKNLSAASLHSELSTEKRRHILQQLQNNKLKLLYLSPETLLSKPVWSILIQPQIKITALIIDEAHCIVQWGDTFRPAYNRLGVVRKALLKTKPTGTKISLAAFTATADPSAQKTIKNVLELQNPQLYLINPYRPNLHLQIQTIWTPRSRRQKLLKFIKSFPNQSGLVYVRTRKDSEILSEWLEEKGYKTSAYHAGLSPQERRIIETDWLTGKTQFVVCTCAFGMGVNKPDVRWVIHYQPPAQLSEYLQEIGRAGRDGKPATALTLISEPTGIFDPQDKQQKQYFEKQKQNQYWQAQQTLKKLPPQGDISAITKQHPHADITLSLLQATGSLTWVDPFNYSIKKQTPLKEPPNLKPNLTEYLQTRQCRWKFLLFAFGFASNNNCGHCDNCLKSQ
ncbi:ATP-dependent DNA helicase [Ancylothrix sp. C2]|uniref:RecQ family ATP-dependent DNA helicase n=1 Tax=Ancylothrix sp. D3o TaxID=2953691 RepID=UPI0021BA7582|nr:ATP-dependent DNA helicase RecQ [Ancylothrix sp. D3o]MCT7949834.1 ATP-dependent DNA helicase [Ancylothrix sp. D3o]